MAAVRKPDMGPRIMAAFAALGAEVGRRPVPAALAIVLVALAVQTFVKSGSEWVDVYVAAGRRLLAGEPLYLPGGNYVYPPFTAMVAAPLSLASPTVSRAVWFVASAAGLVWLMRSCWILSASPDTARLRHWSRTEWVATVLGIACGATYLLNAFAHQQIDVLIGAFLIGGCLQLARGRDLRAGALIGIAAACKATPLVFLPYLLWRRRWMAAVASAAVALGLNLAPDLVAGGKAEPQLVTWVARVVAPTQRIDSRLGAWFSAIIYNQSLAGTLERVANTRLEFIDDELRFRDEPTVPNRALKLGCYVLLGLLFAISAVAAGSGARPAASTVDSVGPDRSALEYSALLALMLLLSPMSSPAHFGVLLLPGLCLARTATIDRSRFLWILLGVSAAVSVAMNGDLAGRLLRTLMLWSGTITIVTLLLWAGCVAVLLRKREQPAATPDRRASRDR